MRRVALVLVALVVVLGALIALRLWTQRRALAAPSGGSGEIEGTTVDLSSRVGARIVEQPVKEGQAVKAGDLILKPCSYQTEDGSYKADCGTLVVPGSEKVKRQAEAEGLDRVFREAGAEWREAGCSMCLAMNDDRLEPGQYAVSTSNRNFEDMVAQQVRWAGRTPCYPGIGVSASSSHFGVDRVIEQIQITRERKTGGFVIFNYGVTESQDLLPLLVLDGSISYTAPPVFCGSRSLER